MGEIRRAADGRRRKTGRVAVRRLAAARATRARDGRRQWPGRYVQFCLGRVRI